MSRYVSTVVLSVVFVCAAGLGLASEGFFKISPDHVTQPERYHPQVAYNPVHDEYLVVWHNTWPGGERDIYAQRIKGNGDQPGPWFCVSCGANDRANPSVAYDWFSDQYLVTWMYDRAGDGTNWAVRGRLIPWNSAGANPELGIHDTDVTSGRYPVVAYDAIRHRFVVAWGLGTNSTPSDPSFTTMGVSFRLVESNGGLGTPGTASAGFDAYNPDITYNVAMDEYFVVWQEGLTKIVGARITGAGARIGGEFYVSETTSFQRTNPTVATDTQSLYMVAWQQYVISDWDIYGGWLVAADPPDQAPLGSYFVATTAEQVAPEAVAVDMNGSFQLLWQETNASNNQSIQRSGYSASWDGANLIAFLHYMPPLYDFAFSDATSPAAVSSSYETMAVFESVDPVSDQQIWGRTPTVFRDAFEGGNPDAWSSSTK